MKKGLFFSALFLTLMACSKEPNACECGRNLMKATQDQDADLAADCEKHAESLPDSKQMDWYNETMACMNEQ